MAYAYRVPPAPLSAYIDDIYYIDGAAQYTRLKVFPMPSQHLIVNLGAPFVAWAEEGGAPITTSTESWWLGLWSRYHIVEWAREVRFYGVHFKPGGAFPFLQIPLLELQDQIVPLDAIWGCFAAEISERLYEAPTAEMGLALMEQLLEERLDDMPHNLPVVGYAIAEIERQRGILPIQGLGEQLGLSQSYLSAQFNRMVGIPPKELARVYRFAHVLNAVDRMHGVDWTWVAHHFCFYDQSHFNKEFAAFTGYNPTAYLQQRRRLYAEHPEEPQMLGQIAIE